MDMKGTASQTVQRASKHERAPLLSSPYRFSSLSRYDRIASTTK